MKISDEKLVKLKEHAKKKTEDAQLHIENYRKNSQTNSESLSLQLQTLLANFDTLQKEYTDKLKQNQELVEIFDELVNQINP